MEALILSCGTGGGHDAAGRALQEELTRRGHHVTMINPYALKSERTADRINNTYIRVAQRAPAVFGLVYGIGNLYRRLPFHSPVYFVNGRMAETMQGFLSEHHFDVVLMPHVFPAEILSFMKDRGMTVPQTIFIATDYTCIPFTEEPDCDAYVIPSEELMPEFTRRGIPEEKLHPLGIPVSRRFSEPMSREEAAARLGLDPKKRYILVSGGSIGAGNMTAVLRTLCRLYRDDRETQIIAICGSRSELSEHLRAQYGDRVTILDHTDQMDAYLSLCEMFLTKPGGLSSTEAAVVGVPILHIAPIPGCETKNVRYFRRLGMGIPVRRSRYTLRRAVGAVETPSVRSSMIQRQHQYVPAGASAGICDLAEQLAAEAT